MSVIDAAEDVVFNGLPCHPEPTNCEEGVENEQENCSQNTSGSADMGGGASEDSHRSLIDKSSVTEAE